MDCCKIIYVPPLLLNPTARSLFVQQGNNRNDLVPIAICCWLLDAGLDRRPVPAPAADPGSDSTPVTTLPPGRLINTRY